MAVAEMVVKCAYTELVDVDQLIPNPKNPNQHPKGQIKILAKIMKYQGVRDPIVVSRLTGFITKGHGRLAAAKQIGWEKFPVDFQEYDNEAQEYADMVADNEIARHSKTDLAMVTMELENLGDALDTDMLGIADLKLEDLKDPTMKDMADMDLDEQFILTVELKGESEMQELYEELLDRGFKCKLIT